MNMEKQEDKVNLGIGGQILQFVLSTGAIKPIFHFYLGFSFFVLLLSWILSIPILAYVWLIASLVIFIYLCVLLPKRPELFVDNKHWYMYSKFLATIGDKNKGMRELKPEEKYYQPVKVLPKSVNK